MVPFELNSAWAEKLEWWSYQAVKKFDDIFSTIHECGGRTDKRTDTGRWLVPFLVHAVKLHGNAENYAQKSLHR